MFQIKSDGVARTATLLSLSAGIFALTAIAAPAQHAWAEEVVQSGGSYTATIWDADTSKAYYRVDGKAIVNEHGGKVSRSQNAIQHGDLDKLGRATWSAGYITPALWAKEAAEGRESTALPNPVGWRDNKQVTIELYDGKNPYNGYFYNRSHLVADSLGGDPIKENLVTGTRTQNVGANDGKGGMAYAETKVRNYMTANPLATVFYSAIPVYVGDELVPRSVYVDVRSDDGSMDEHIEVYNTANGFYVNYADGSWGTGDPNSTRGGSRTGADSGADSGTSPAKSLVSIRNGKVYSSIGKMMTSGSYKASYNKGKPVCPVSYVVTTGGQKVSKGNFLTYYFKNRKKGVATVVLRGVHSKGYKDAIILKYKIA